MRLIRSRWFAVFVVVGLLAVTSTYLMARDAGTPEAAAAIARVKRGELGMSAEEGGARAAILLMNRLVHIIR